MPAPCDDHLTTLTKKTFTIAPGVPRAREQAAARLSQLCKALGSFHDCSNFGAMEIAPWTFGSFPRLDQDHWEFLTSSKGYGAPHILQIMKWSK